MDDGALEVSPIVPLEPLCVLCGGYIEPKYATVGLLAEYACDCKSRVILPDQQQILDRLTSCVEKSLFLNGLIRHETYTDTFARMDKVDVSRTVKKVEQVAADAPVFKEDILRWLRSVVMV